ncbi:hypothetical protein RB195_015411 [Necator americanus]|uniref:PAN domain protein n=1 Tax=Necator americanus TaxID=51031 RepID=A0ABR1E4G3_NECAM
MSKHLGADPGSVVRMYREKFMDYPANKIINAKNEYECLSNCVMEEEFLCQSANFFTENGDCLLNNATSLKASILDNEEKSSVYYMEVQNFKKKNRCSRSFHVIPWNQIVIRGEAKLVNVPKDYNQCIRLCGDCDYVVYNEFFSECFLVYYDQNGQKFNFITDEYQVFENLCKQPLDNCSAKNAMYISYYNKNSTLRSLCLQRCIADKSCKYAYLANSTCTLSPREKPLQKIIEKHCVGFEELSIGILFKESVGCPKRKVKNIAVEATELMDCMLLCLTHPTKSCEAITFYSEGRCLLLSGTTGPDSEAGIEADCRHFKLNAIRFEGTSKKKGDAKKKMRKSQNSSRAKAFNGNRKSQIKIRKEPFSDGGIELTVETICNYDSILFKVTSPVHIDGKIFPRNAHDNCSLTINGTTAVLKMPLHSENCSVTKTGLLYENVIVVKQNTLEEVPVITEYDQLYRISCDYTNHTSKIAATSILQIHDSNYARVLPFGRVQYDPVKMELRSKPGKEAKTVILGQDVDLKIADEDKIIVSNFTVSTCTANGSDRNENITLIEDGCPTRSAREYIVRGEIKKEGNGFLIPLRAFRFKNSDGVRIICRLDTCKQSCTQRSCSNVLRKRRYLSEDTLDLENSEEVEVSLVVSDSVPFEKSYCFTRAGLISLLSIGSITASEDGEKAETSGK